MDKAFWLERWENSEIGFHQQDINPYLINYFPRLSLEPGSRVFVPLCGKTLDIGWLLAQGYQVVGVELSERAVTELFAELGVAPTVTDCGTLTQYHVESLTVYVGDFFALDQHTLGRVDGVYDRGALVALPADLRTLYTSHLLGITACAPQLLLTIAFDITLITSPPFSLEVNDVSGYYQNHFTLTQLSQDYLPEGLKGKYPVEETTWLLTPSR